MRSVNRANFHDDDLAAIVKMKGFPVAFPACRPCCVSNIMDTPGASRRVFFAVQFGIVQMSVRFRKYVCPHRLCLVHFVIVRCRARDYDNGASGSILR